MIYGNTNESVAVAMRARMFACRIPPTSWSRGRLEWDQLLSSNQKASVAMHYNLLREHSRQYHDHIQFTDLLQEVTEHHDDPHPKAKLRIRAFEEELLVYGFKSSHWGKNDYVTAKLKKDELAKTGKAPRVIVDLGVPMSLVGFRLTKFMKNIFAEPLYIHGGVAQYCDKPSHDALKHHFHQLHSPDLKFHFVFFSDDSCWAVRTATRHMRRFNVDIKSCDVSHRSTFQLLYAVVPVMDHPVLDALIAQLSKKIVIRDVNEYKRKVVIQFDGPTLFSGSTLTTVLNNLAQWLAASCLKVDDLEVDPERAISEAYDRAGFMVTIDEVSFAEVQFLKHSPVYDTNDQLRPVLNLGVLLRASGTCRGDLPSGPSFEERARTFQSGLVQGMYPYTRFTLVNRLRGRPTEAHTNKHVVSTAESFTVSDDALYLRYSLTQAEIDELNDIFGTASTGDFVSLTAIDKILALDYDSSVDWTPPREYYLDD